MNRMIIILILLLIVLILYCNCNLNESFKFIYDSQNKNCCLVEKKYLPDSSDVYGGNFKYTYKKLSNEQCDITKHNSDNNKQLLIDGYNGWDNYRCDNKKEINKIGSCRNTNKECIDFVDKQFCDKYRMEWSTNTCNKPTNYTWDNKNIIVKPESNDGGEFVMFNKTI